MTRTFYRQGSADSAAVLALVPGDYRQTEEDLAAFSQPVLDMLSRYGTRVAILDDGQTLADTPGLRTMNETEVATEAKAVNALLSSSLAKANAGAVSSYEQLESLAEDLTRQLRNEGSDHTLGIALSPFSLDDLAKARGIPAEKVEAWQTAFARLNAGLVDGSGDGMKARYGLVVLPHTYHQGMAVPENRLRNAREVSSDFVKGALGLNRSDERMVLLHQSFLASPSAELGNYRLVLHEVGHALDHALENLVNFPGFGPLHRQTVDALFAADQAKVAAGVPADKVFTSDRADDDVREYFAEAVEAYLTPESSNGHDTFRAGNSSEGLARKNPALFAYIEKVMTTEFGDGATPKLPKRTFAPPGFPDPDLEVLRIS
jgi:hypothetical protein